MTEPKVVRYAIYGPSGMFNLVAAPDGEWVSYSDYEALAEKMEDSEYRNVHLEKVVDDFKARVKEYEDHCANLTTQSQVLAARVEELERLLGGYRSEMVDCEIENNKLREALGKADKEFREADDRKIWEMFGDVPVGGPEYWRRTAQMMAALCRAALKETEDE